MKTIRIQLMIVSRSKIFVLKQVNLLTYFYTLTESDEFDLPFAKGDVDQEFERINVD